MPVLEVLRRIYLCLFRWSIILRTRLRDFWMLFEHGLVFLSGQIVAHPIFAHILTLVVLVLGLVSGVETVVYIATALGWFVTFLWINESIRQHRISRRLILSVIIPGIIWGAFGWLAVSQYWQHQQAKIESPKQVSGLSQKDLQDTKQEELSTFWKSEPSKEQTKPEPTKPIPERTKPQPQLILIFKESPLLTQARKDRIAAEMERFYVYLIQLGLDAPKEVAPIGLTKSGAFTGAGIYPGPVYMDSISIPEKRIDDHTAAVRAYAMYCFPVILDSYNPNRRDWEGRGTRAAWVFERYFVASFYEQLSAIGTSDIDKWAEALWDVRRQIGKAQTDRILSFTLKAFKDFSDDNPKEKFSRYFYNSLMAGVSVVDNEGNLIQKINNILKAKGLPD